jgi:hypothetical protein
MMQVRRQSNNHQFILLEEEGEKYRTDRQDSVRTLPLPSSKHESEQESRRRAVSDLPSRPNPKDLLKLSKADANGEKQASSAEDSGVDKSNGVAPCKIIKHVPTECSCGKNGEHYPSVALDEIYTGTLETINNLLYNSGFTKKFLVEKEKCTGKSNIYSCVLLVEYVVLTQVCAFQT